MRHALYICYLIASSEEFHAVEKSALDFFTAAACPHSVLEHSFPPGISLHLRLLDEDSLVTRLFNRSFPQIKQDCPEHFSGAMCTFGILREMFQPPQNTAQQRGIGLPDV